MAAHPLPPQCNQQENRRLCDVTSAIVDWNAPKIGDRPPLPVQKSHSNRALIKGITLGNNIWVGAKVTFLDGSQVGDNSVVAAGAVVKGVFPNNVIIGGVPAKILKVIE